MSSPAVVDRVPEAMQTLREGLARRIVGMDDVVEHVLYCLLCNGHGLLVGVPGLAKTLLCSTLAEMLDLEFKRIQFTPDLMPGDIVGTETLGELPDGSRGFRFVPGPIFANFLLADEINRTPPKTQAALMEAMEESVVTSGGRRHELDPPFIVLATQNPIEQEGTYELPAAQRDRFLVRVLVRYPDELDEKQIVRRTTAGATPDVERVLSRAEILELQRFVRESETPTEVARYATKLARTTRPDGDGAEVVGELVSWGAGPRAAQAAVFASKARALIQGRRAPTPADVRHVLPAVLAHRVIPSYRALAEGMDSEAIVDLVLSSVPAPDGWSPEPEVVETGWFQRLYQRLRA